MVQNLREFIKLDQIWSKRQRQRCSPSQVKSGVATSWMGISFRKAGRWQRGFPLTTLVFFSHWPSQDKWQSHTYGLDKRLLWEEGDVSIIIIDTVVLSSQRKDPWTSPSHKQRTLSRAFATIVFVEPEYVQTEDKSKQRGTKRKGHLLLCLFCEVNQEGKESVVERGTSNDWKEKK